MGELAQAVERTALGYRVMRGRLALIRRLPPRVVIERALGLVGRTAGAAHHRRRDSQLTTYCSGPPDGELLQLIGTIPGDCIDAASGWIVGIRRF